MLTIRLQQGLSLVEFMVSIVVSMIAMVSILGLYTIGFAVDHKSVKLSRLHNEMTAITSLLSGEIKRAGYVDNAENIILTPQANANASRCSPVIDGCSPLEYRTLSLSQYTGEINNSCIIFAYDQAPFGMLGDNDRMGYRINDGIVEVRAGGQNCSGDDWEPLTDISLMRISNFAFNVCGQNDLTPAQCADFSFPPTAAANDVFLVTFTFTATLVDPRCSFEATDPDCISLTATETVMVRNASYN
ncbi:hypothetical protein [Psychrobium sp. 1_MG-2023]|uniref:hypothetical protein n=1 Tax=Psychrobium sp. 1_MG-2023 TaxID=3062624 RepID=UPI000C33D478|nr:hypothetical protein [Psychrobium sp. 1_MG-2023]MDP2559641.1 hypothetical protein [Psychrobium sp. 1_MG-2023]PKF59473.1 hypothetical protein CW748_01500 [Alteromonadales bacterium alter-6D02]